MKIYIFLLFFLICATHAEDKIYKRVAYVTPTTNSHSSFNFTKITDLILRKIEIKADGLINLEAFPPNVHSIVNSAHKANVNVLIQCIGTPFREMQYSEKARETFVAEVFNFCLDNQLQGVELKWESESGFTNKDRVYYTQLLKELRATFSSEELLITMSGGTWSYEINCEAITYLDWLNIRSYDMGVPDHATMEDALRAYHWWRDLGVPSKKLTLGIPFYGTNIYSQSKSYADLCSSYPASSIEGDMAGGYHFNSIHTVQEKAKFVMENSLLGVNISDISQDCSHKDHSLLNIIDTTLGIIGTSSLLPPPKTTTQQSRQTDNHTLFDVRGRVISPTQSLPIGIYFNKRVGQTHIDLVK